MIHGQERGAPRHPAGATDPVCGRRIRRQRAYIVIEHRGSDYYLCCPLCQAEFERFPDKYVAKAKNQRG